MPIEYITVSQSANYNVQTNDDVFVLAGVNLTSSDGGIVANEFGNNNNISVTVQGGVYGQTGINLLRISNENNDI